MRWEWFWTSKFSGKSELFWIVGLCFNINLLERPNFCSIIAARNWRDGLFSSKISKKNPLIYFRIDSILLSENTDFWAIFRYWSGSLNRFRQKWYLFDWAITNLTGKVMGMQICATVLKWVNCPSFFDNSDKCWSSSASIHLLPRISVFAWPQLFWSKIILSIFWFCLYTCTINSLKSLS